MKTIEIAIPNLYPMDSINSNMLLYEVARHNFNTFRVKDYDIEQMNFGSLGLLVVKGLDNFKEAVNYRTLFEQDQQITIPRQVHYVIISVDNFNLLLNEGRTFEDYFNYLEEKNDKQHSDLEKKELDEAEAVDLGAEDYFDSGALCFIEWPERIDGLLPDDTVRVDITVNDDESRTLKMTFPTV